ncbi:hypothetical protein [Amycolatopsis palatopharyngis]|uniref:hypothetical protein n=1 Tax=Amycolatopsis palatopharyngis TaxID=187982 RepID=UPI000E2454D9|nr:hypothetical protein [Amycolatopsis palatopharyngis]
MKLMGHHHPGERTDSAEPADGGTRDDLSERLRDLYARAGQLRQGALSANYSTDDGVAADHH